MGGLAALAREAGHTGTGCDSGVYPPMSDQLRALGIELVAAPVGSPHRAVLLGRPGGPAFRQSEVLRLAHLCGIAATVTAADARH